MTNRSHIIDLTAAVAEGRIERLPTFLEIDASKRMSAAEMQEVRAQLRRRLELMAREAGVEVIEVTYDAIRPGSLR